MHMPYHNSYGVATYDGDNNVTSSTGSAPNDHVGLVLLENPFGYH